MYLFFRCCSKCLRLFRTFDDPLEWPSLSISDDEVVLVILALEDTFGNLLGSSNIYWLSNPVTLGQDYTWLGSIREKARVSGGPLLDLSIRRDPTSNSTELAAYIVSIVNVGSQLREGAASESTSVAFMLTLSVHYEKAAGDVSSSDDEITDNRVLPIWFDDNYMTILPGKSLRTRFSVSSKLVQDNGRSYFVLVDGWNIFSSTKYYFTYK